MSGYLLDTNVLSELARQKPEQAVVEFFNDLENAYISVLTLYELNYGLELMPVESKQRVILSNRIDSMITAFGDRVLPVTYREARLAASLRADSRKAGRTLHLIDLLITATAFAQKLAVVTRNEKDFEGLGIGVLNPWSKGKSKDHSSD